MMALVQKVNQDIVGLAYFSELFCLLFTDLGRGCCMSVRVVDFCLVTESRLSAAGLKVVEKVLRQIHFLAKQGAASIEDCCFRLKIHFSQALWRRQYSIFYSLSAA